MPGLPQLVDARAFPGRRARKRRITTWSMQKGNAVAVTYTLNNSYGNGITVPGLGFLLNDEMDDFVAKPGEPNMFGLVGGDANAIEPGKRPLSSMTPTIITQRRQAVHGGRRTRRFAHHDWRDASDARRARFPHATPRQPSICRAFISNGSLISCTLKNGFPDSGSSAAEKNGL